MKLPNVDTANGVALIVRRADADFPHWNTVIMPAAAMSAESMTRSLRAGREFMLRRAKVGSLLSPLERLALAANGLPIDVVLASIGLQEAGRLLF